jgi:cyclophilin family peptidyl-prolyl cis-trans isomerase
VQNDSENNGNMEFKDNLSCFLARLVLNNPYQRQFVLNFNRQPMIDPSPTDSGQVFDEFLILEQIGSGGNDGSDWTSDSKTVAGGAEDR